MKQEIMIIANYAKNSLITPEELCEICNITMNVLEEFISYEIIHPRLSSNKQILFELKDLQRIKTALRLQHDLELNLAGVALVLDLLDEIDELRERMKFLERDF